MTRSDSTPTTSIRLRRRPQRGADMGVADLAVVLLAAGRRYRLILEDLISPDLRAAAARGRLPAVDLAGAFATSSAACSAADTRRLRTDRRRDRTWSTRSRWTSGRRFAAA